MRDDTVNCMRVLGAADPTLVTRAIAALPPCYTNEFDACLNADKPTDPTCQLYNQAYDADQPRMHTAVLALPSCQQQQQQRYWLAGVGLEMLALGILLGKTVLK